MDKNLAERLKYAREKAKFTQEKLAQRLNIALPTLSKYENAHRTPDAELLGRIAKEVRCDPGWLLVGEEKLGREIPVVTDIDDLYEVRDKFVSIPQVSGFIDTGGGLLPDTIIEIRIAFRKDWIQRKGDPSKMSLIRVKGDSMEPTLFRDLILVDHDRNYIDPNGGIYAIAVRNEIVAKRLEFNLATERIRVISDNPTYPPLEIEPDRLHINGKVIWVGRELER